MRTTPAKLCSVGAAGFEPAIPRISVIRGTHVRAPPCTVFTIGLWELNLDGTQKLDADGEPIPTYDTPHVVTFARVWTGFDLQPWRGNLESANGAQSENYVDPLRLRANGMLDWNGNEVSWRDSFPKMDLYDGHLGDGYPVCNQLPRRHFLRKGARYSYLGRTPSAKLQYLRYTTEQGGTFLELRSSSALYLRLCDAGGGGPTSSRCRFPSDVELEEQIPCDSEDGTCSVDTVHVLKLVDANETVYYEYQRLPCVELTFTNATMQRLVQGRSCGKCTHRYTCADPADAVGGAPACCSSPSAYYSSPGGGNCKYQEESVTFSTAVARCAAVGKHVCYNFRQVNHAPCGYGQGNFVNQWVWQGHSCRGAQVRGARSPARRV